MQRRATFAGPARLAAFTLMELLVVIGIVSVLVGLLLPTFGRVREAARRTDCMTKAKQIAMSMRSYAADNNGYLPAPAEASRPTPRDWVHWQPTMTTPPRDPVRGGILKYMPQDARAKLVSYTPL